MLLICWVYGVLILNRSVSGFLGCYCVQILPFFADTELRLASMFVRLSIQPLCKRDCIIAHSIY